jgi:hypothetical protein
VLSPDVPTHWLNLGDAAYQAGDDAEALAAWTRGARLAPRDVGLRRALTLVPAADAASAHWLWVSVVTPAELWLLGLVAWLAGWAGILWTRRIDGRWVVLLGAGALLIGGSTMLRGWYARPTAVVTVNTVLRLSPSDLAPSVGEVPRLGAVRLEASRGPWVRVVGPGGQEGWLHTEETAPVAPMGAS